MMSARAPSVRIVDENRADPAELADAELVRQVLAGDVNEYGKLIQRHQDTLHRVAFAMVQDGDIVADLVQDVFIAGYVNLASCRNPARLRVWLLVMLRNRCLDFLKARRRRDIPLELLPGEPATSGASVLSGIADRTELRRALAALPESLREAFLLRHVEELEYEEMAELLETTVAGVKMRVSRAREALRRHLVAAEDMSA
jgi:RNA polymerase sigma-70 factor, ECF subfamily